MLFGPWPHVGAYGVPHRRQVPLHGRYDLVRRGRGYSFISTLAESNKLAVKSLAELEQKLRTRGLRPVILTGHTGWTDDLYFAFAHRDKLCSPFKKKVHDPSAPYDAYDESDDTGRMRSAAFCRRCRNYNER